jgi:hypothetical protein
MRQESYTPEITDLGAASAVTLGIPKLDAVEDLTEQNFKD